MNWYEDTLVGNEVFVAARVRLIRNLRDYMFPDKMREEECEELIGKLREKLDAWKDPVGNNMNFIRLDKTPHLMKQALREHRVINESLATKVKPAGLYLSGDESVSVSLLGDDHIRLQVMSTEVSLDRLWNMCNALDNSINEHFNYAFHDKYGYLTAFPTNMGTGLRVSVILHLPYLSGTKNFAKLITEVARYGVTVKMAFGEGEEKLSCMYEVSNNNTLGVSEEEIVSLVYRMASHLAVNEKQTREQRFTPLQREDDAYKAYGRLRYARLLTVRDALACLSTLRSGVGEELVTLREPINLFGLMINCCPASLAQKNMLDNVDNLGAIRANYVRQNLPELTTF